MNAQPKFTVRDLQGKDNNQSPRAAPLFDYKKTLIDNNAIKKPSQN